MINLFRGKRVLFVFSDPAGAKSLLAFSDSHKKIFEASLLISNRDHPFYGEFDSQVKTILNDLDKLIRLINEFNPDIIFTTTSFPAGIELNCIKIALKLRNVTTISFVDHWINFKARFIDNDVLYLPEKILVLDKRAKQFAKEEGIPEGLIFEFENPYYSYLKAWKSQFTPNEISKTININKKYYLYAPEPLSKFGLKKKFGFDEFQVLKFIINNIFQKGINHDYILVYKCHPNQSAKFVEKMIQNNYLPDEIDNILILNDSIININDLIFHSKGVLGIFSNSLVESVLIGKKTAQIIPYLSDPHLNPLTNVEGIVSIKNGDDFLNFLKD